MWLATMWIPHWTAQADDGIMGDYLLFHLLLFKLFFYNEKALFCNKEKVALFSFKTFTDYRCGFSSRIF